MVAAIERGYPQQEIAESAYAFQQAVERKDRLVVGVNAFVAADAEPIRTLYIDESAETRQLARLRDVRARRDEAAVERALAALRDGAGSGANTMPLFIAASREYATVGEMCDVLREVWGEYVEAPVI